MKNNYYYTTTAASQADYKIRRERDENDEKIVGEYLDNYFYPQWTSSFTRNHDKDTQIKGLDITVTSTGGVKYTIDEKAATRWVGKTLKTFAHEINSVNKRGKLYDGWLLDFHSASDYLLEVWVDGVSTNDNRLHKYTDITDITIALISKQDLWYYLKRNNINSTELKELGNYLRNTKTYSEIYKGFKVMCQQTNQEAAANILIPRDTLINTISKFAVQIKDENTIILRK